MSSSSLQRKGNKTLEKSLKQCFQQTCPLPATGLVFFFSANSDVGVEHTPLFGADRNCCFHCLYHNSLQMYSQVNYFFSKFCLVALSYF